MGRRHTHSWPFRSCARASSGCRICARPDRRSVPVPWSCRGASPSGSPSAWSSCISPLEARTQGRRKVPMLSVGKLLECALHKESYRNIPTGHVFMQKLFTNTQEHLAMQSKGNRRGSRRCRSSRGRNEKRGRAARHQTTKRQFGDRNPFDEISTLWKMFEQEKIMKPAALLFPYRFLPSRSKHPENENAVNESCRNPKTVAWKLSHSTV